MALTKVSSGLISADAALVDLNIDAGTLYIDATNNRVGVRNQAPTVALEVTGDLVVSASATLGNTQVGQLTFSSLTNTTTDIPEGTKLFFTEQRVLDTVPGGSLSGTLGDVTVQYRTDGNYSGTAQQGSFYFDALNQRLKVYTGSEFIDTIPFTAGGGGGATTEANATFFNYQYTVTSETNNISGADIQEIESGAYVIGKDYEISVPGTTDFTALGAADNNIGTTFTATASGLVSAGDFVATEEYTIVSVDDGAGGATTDFTLIGAANNNIGTTFTATGVGAGTGTASQGSGTAHGILGYSTSSSTDVVVFVNGVKQRESTVDGYQATTGTTIAFTYNLPVDSIVDVQVYELLKNDAYYTKAQTYTQAEVNSQISTALSTYDDQTASDARYVNITGDTMTGDLNLGDNVKATFGDAVGGDLQIYHDGLHSYVSDQGTGNLRIYANDLVLANNDGSETFLYGVNGGAVSISYANNAKLTTTATGIDVTGTVTADGLTVDGADPQITLNESDTTDLNTNFRNGLGTFAIRTANDAGSSFTNRLKVDHSTGDISFYDGSANQAFFWDASAASLGIGTTSPTSPNGFTTTLEVEGSSASLVLTDNSGAGASSFELASSSGSFRIYDETDERLRIDASGTLLVNDFSARTYDVYGGTSSAGMQLAGVTASSATFSINRYGDVANGAQIVLAHSRGAAVGTNTIVADDDPLGIINFDGANGTGYDVAAQIRGEVDGTPGATTDMPGRLTFWTTPDGSGAPVERMRIDATGNTTFKANNSAVGPVVTLENTATAVNGQAWGSIHFDSNDSSTGASGTRASIVGTSTSFNGDGNLDFYTAPASGTNTFAMRIDSSGNVKIADGDLEFTAAQSNYSIYVPDAASETYNPGDRGNITIKASGSTAGSQAMSGGRVFITAGDSHNGQTGDIVLSTGTNLLNASDNGVIRFNIGGTASGNEKMRIDSSGSLLVGGTTVTSPSGATGPLLLIEGANPELIFRDDTGTANNMSMYYINDNLVWYSGSSENLRLTNSGNLTVAGALSKGSGSFRIDHPLPEKTETHHLVHSFVESPQADNIYRGKVDLVDGSATVNIDTVFGMTEGTFVLLNTNTQCFTSNESGWTAVKGSVSGNILTITAQESCSDTISWLVIGERHDQHMLDTDWTDENGKVIVEPLKQEVAQLEGAN